MNRLIPCVLLSLLAGCASHTTRPQPTPIPGDNPMPLGNFSVSLAVKDLKASQAFYEKLGFKVFAGNPAQNWLVLKNGTTNIGLFQGLFDRNTLTFNPGWDNAAQPLKDFKDVREIQAELQRQGLTLVMHADPASTGPAALMVMDPDGNPVLIDQHVPKPAR